MARSVALIDDVNRSLRKCLREWLAESEAGEIELWAYGNSSGDAELLAMADHACLVAGRSPQPLLPLR